MAAIDPKILTRYLHVKALAERGGTDGERAAAASLLAGLEAKHPGIREAASAHAAKDAKTDAGAGSDPFAGFAGGFPFAGDLFGGKVSPDDVIRAFETLRDLFGADESAEGSGDDEAVATLREVAERVEVNLKVSKKGEASLYARLTPDDLEDAADAIETPEHAAAFAAIVGARVADALRESLMDALFDGDEDEED
jgi:hypothetical protein